MTDTSKATALKSFLFSHNGYTELFAEIGKEVEIPIHLVENLVKDGYIKLVTAVEGKTQDPGKKAATAPSTQQPAPILDLAEVLAARAQVEIPEDWSSLAWFAKRSLAAKVSNLTVDDLTPDMATAAIQAELDRRAALAAAAAPASTPAATSPAADPAATSSTPAADPAATPAATEAASTGA